jgi:hypothetical protein
VLLFKSGGKDKPSKGKTKNVVKFLLKNISALSADGLKTSVVTG